METLLQDILKEELTENIPGMVRSSEKLPLGNEYGFDATKPYDYDNRRHFAKQLKGSLYDKLKSLSNEEMHYLASLSQENLRILLNDLANQK